MFFSTFLADRITEKYSWLQTQLNRTNVRMNRLLVKTVFTLDVHNQEIFTPSLPDLCFNVIKLAHFKTCNTLFAHHLLFGIHGELILLPFMNYFFRYTFTFIHTKLFLECIQGYQQRGLNDDI